MGFFTRRRISNLTLLLAALAGAWLWVRTLDASLSRTAHATGYALYFVMLWLAAFNLRKKMPGIPFGSGSFWLQVHVYAALGSSVLFYWHIGGSWPDGWLEGGLAAIYGATFLSGVYGLWLSRTAPKQLARVGSQVLFERVPAERRRVGVMARATVLEAVRATGATTLSDFYADRLHGFFQRPRTFGYLLSPTSATRKRLFHELNAISRLLTDAERAACDRLFRLIQQKDDLDFQRSRQGMLKVWIFVHLALTWALLLIGAMHGMAALALRGGTA